MKRFTCPKCGGGDIEEIRDGVTVTSEVTNIVKSGPNQFYCAHEGDMGLDDGGVERYQCVGCGREVTNEEMMDLADDDECQVDSDGCLIDNDGDAETNMENMEKFRHTRDCYR